MIQRIQTKEKKWFKNTYINIIDKSLQKVTKVGIDRIYKPQNLNFTNDKNQVIILVLSRDYNLKSDLSFPCLRQNHLQKSQLENCYIQCETKKPNLYYKGLMLPIKFLDNGLVFTMAKVKVPISRGPILCLHNKQWIFYGIFTLKPVNFANYYAANIPMQYEWIMNFIKRDSILN
ncbi:DgyrCDS14586 [Dimorphilus gyrociliatus]|uniref:DgyrCDS14586 n=1 Tax=Dimorphilus gyrociliatus TaxID=2664684 RepID=A0A7I8WE67_9ANNE|nr:DgyrCDS14586 [Dimorphilus gyrociliatus]